MARTNGKKKNGSLKNFKKKFTLHHHQALTRWGGALLELAHFCHGAEAYEKISTAVSKFDEALAIDPKKHDALWCLGNAFTSQGFLTADSGAAGALFRRAAGCFERALAEDPESEVYRKALEMTSKAPELHEELQKQLHASQVGGGGGTSSSGFTRSSPRVSSSPRKRGLKSSALTPMSMRTLSASMTW